MTHYWISNYCVFIPILRSDHTTTEVIKSTRTPTNFWNTNIIHYKRNNKDLTNILSLLTPIMEEQNNNLNKPLILIHRIPQFNISFQSWLQPRFTLLETSLSSQETCSARALVSVGPSPVTSQVLDRYPSVELVVGSGAGINHIDVEECLRRNVKVTNAGDAFSEDAADYAVVLLLDVLRKVSASDRFVRAGTWPVKGEYALGSKVGGKRVGIVGLGNIGYLVAKRLEAFGCHIAYNSRKKKPTVPYPFYGNVKDLATNCDALIVCCALTDETHHMINKDVMTALGKEGVIVNVGRGAVIDEKELVLSLVQGELGGAGLDVFEDEPHVPKELFDLDNVVLSPHTAVLTPESMEAVQHVVIANLEAFFANKPLRSEVKLD